MCTGTHWFIENCWGFKAGVNVKAALTSLNSLDGLSPNISVTFQATLNLSAYFINHYVAVLCKFLGDFWERDFFSKDRLN